MLKRESNTSLPAEEPWTIWQGSEIPPIFTYASQSSQGLRPIPGRETLNFPQMTKSERVWQASTFPAPARRVCRVPGCSLRNCKLITHQRYNSQPSSGQYWQRKEKTQIEKAFNRLTSYDQDGPLADRVDGFPKLPLQEALDPAIRSLFHFFFTNSFDKLAALFRGPSVSDMQVFKERMLATALTSEAYCRALVLQAQNEQDVAKGIVEETQETLSLNNNTVKSFRKQLASIHENPYPLQIELALLVVCILMMYNFCHDKARAQRVHWQGMRDLVAMRGGIHSVTTALAYVIHADRMCAIQFEEQPTYPNMLINLVPTPFPSANTPTYGSMFRWMREHSASLDHAVVNYLVDVSGLVEMWEEQRIQLVTKHSQRLGASLDYLHFTRDRLDERFASLNAQWAQVDKFERCMLWTSRIVEYPVTWSNYIPPMTRDMCDKLVKALQTQPSLVDIWGPRMEATRWMLFVLTVADAGPENHSWASHRLHGILRRKLGEAPWPEMWWVDEEANLLKFTWSSSYYVERFRLVCDKLEGRS